VRGRVEGPIAEIFIVAQVGRQRGPDTEPNLRSGEGCVKSKALLTCIIGAK